MYPRVCSKGGYSLLRLSIALCLPFILPVHAAQYSVESSISARAEYNDNIFLTTLPHDSVNGFIVIPEARMVAREANWETFLGARLRSNNYSDSNLDSNDIYLDASGTYSQERNVFSLAGQYYKDSNLNALREDFGLVGERINRELWSVTPEYQRLLTERAVLALTYSHVDVEYLEAEDTRYVPYTLDTVSGSIAYSLSETDTLNFILQATDYQSKDEVLEYQLFIARVGVEHEFSELWSADFSIGGSSRDATVRVTPTEEAEFSDSGYVLDASLTRAMETGGEFLGRISRENIPNAFGGLDEVDMLEFILGQNITERWRYSIVARYRDIDAVSDVDRRTDREIVLFEPRLYYAIGRQWTVEASYRYIQRKFRNDISDSAPHSNRVFIGMTYNFPDISTF